MANLSNASTSRPTSPYSRQSRVAEAVQVAPYLTHVVRHHGQITLIPPENAGRTRKEKKKRPKVARETSSTDDRSSLNVARPTTRTARLRPSSPSSFGSDTRVELHRQRTVSPVRDVDTAIPDFPPPSFEEAISSNQNIRYTSSAPPTFTTQPQSTSFDFAQDTQSSTHDELSGPPRNVSGGSCTPHPEVPMNPDLEHSLVSLSSDYYGRSQWEEDRLLGFSLEERVRREFQRQQKLERPSVTTVNSSQISEAGTSHLPGSVIEDSKSEDHEPAVASPNVQLDEYNDRSVEPEPLRRRRSNPATSESIAPSSSSLAASETHAVSASSSRPSSATWSPSLGHGLPSASPSKISPSSPSIPCMHPSRSRDSSDDTIAQYEGSRPIPSQPSPDKGKGKEKASNDLSPVNGSIQPESSEDSWEIVNLSYPGDKVKAITAPNVADSNMYFKPEVSYPRSTPHDLQSSFTSPPVMSSLDESRIHISSFSASKSQENVKAENNAGRALRPPCPPPKRSRLLETLNAPLRIPDTGEERADPNFISTLTPRSTMGTFAISSVAVETHHPRPVTNDFSLHLSRTSSSTPDNSSPTSVSTTTTSSSIPPVPSINTSPLHPIPRVAPRPPPRTQSGPFGKPKPISLSLAQPDVTHLPEHPPSPSLTENTIAQSKLEQKPNTSSSPTSSTSAVGASSAIRSAVSLRDRIAKFETLGTRPAPPLPPPPRRPVRRPPPPIPSMRDQISQESSRLADVGGSLNLASTSDTSKVSLKSETVCRPSPSSPQPSATRLGMLPSSSGCNLNSSTQTTHSQDQCLETVQSVTGQLETSLVSSDQTGVTCTEEVLVHLLDTSIVIGGCEQMQRPLTPSPVTPSPRPVPSSLIAPTHACVNSSLMPHSSTSAEDVSIAHIPTSSQFRTNYSSSRSLPPVPIASHDIQPPSQQFILPRDARPSQGEDSASAARDLELATGNVAASYNEGFTPLHCIAPPIVCGAPPIPSNAESFLHYGAQPEMSGSQQVSSENTTPPSPTHIHFSHEMNENENSVLPSNSLSSAFPDSMHETGETFGSRSPDQSGSRPAASTTPTANEAQAETSEGLPSSPVSPPLPLLAPLQPVFTGYTDLDILLSRLETDGNGGSDGVSYEDLQTISDIIGPASATPQVNTRAVMDDIPMGRVEIQRRRVMKDGRVKLKLSLLGVVVDKCGICLSQFRKEDWACLVPCQHAFHERCLRSWLLRSMTCPLCRAHLHAAESSQ